VTTCGFHIAQINVALPKAPVDSPLLEEFVAALDPINAIADASPGFVWRLQTEDGNATAIRPFEDERILVNMSVWESIDALADFVYRSGHLNVMRRRREWFERTVMHIALWWVPAGHIPSVAEAAERLDYLREHGPTPYAFTFKASFSVEEQLVIDEQTGCPA
jgi:uncharacterized protein DUF3291